MMNYEKIGNFIRTLREEHGWSQEKLANKIYVDRTKINKLEKGTRNIQLEDVIVLSELFDVSFEEIIAGEKKTSKNKYQLHKMFSNYLKEQNSKIKKAKFFTILWLGVLVIFFIILTVLYFFQNFRSIKVYKFYGESENYVINNGILILSKEKIYFQINNIKPDVSEIEIYTEINNEKSLVYKGSHDIIFNDFYGYNSFISYDDFINGKQNIYIKINGSEIKLNFIEDFTNNKFFYSKFEKIGKSSFDEKKVIPPRIQNLFFCDNNSCFLENKNELLIYSNDIFKVEKNSNYFSYDLENEIFEYTKMEKEDVNLNFIILKNGKILCNIGKCENANKIFLSFQKSYINKYLQNN